VRCALALGVAMLFLLAACSRTVDVPRERVEASSTLVEHTHRIWTVSGDEYCVEAFRVVESTVVISKLNPSDPRYDKADLPISVPLDSVQTVKRVEHKPSTWMIVGAVGAFVLAAAWLSDGEAFTD